MGRPERGAAASPSHVLPGGLTWVRSKLHFDSFQSLKFKFPVEWIYLASFGDSFFYFNARLSPMPAFVGF